MQKFIFPTAFFLCSTAAMAETFTLESKIAEVTVYPQGASITRTVAFDLPAGRHQLIIPDIPDDIRGESLQILPSDGLEFGALGVRDQRLPPDDRENPDRLLVQAHIDRVQAEITEKQQSIGRINARIEAANARIDFLDALGQQQAENAVGAMESGTVSVETLTAMVGLVGSETLNAKMDIQSAREEIAAVQMELADLQEELRDLQTRLESVGLPPYPRLIASIDVFVPEAVSGHFEISYQGARFSGWTPVYDLYLDQDSGTLHVDRKVVIQQSTGEEWADALISVSTSRPSEQSQMPEIGAQRAFYYTPQVIDAFPTSGGGAVMGYNDTSRVMAAPMVAVVEPDMSVGVEYQGVTAVYRLPEGTIVPGDDQPAMITVGGTDFDADLSAQVNMQARSTDVFLMASFTNTDAQPFLPGEMSFYRDGAFVGAQRASGFIAPDTEASFGFGVIDGFSAKRVTRNRQDGESGVLTTSNERIEEYELQLENRSGQDWDVTVFDRVPYSEQEELQIDYAARPRPDQVDVDGKRGVMAWNFRLNANESQDIRLSYTLTWPVETELSFN